MLAGRSCMLVFFPIFGTVLALVLSIITILGSSPSAPGLQSLYFMRVDFRNVTSKTLHGVAIKTQHTDSHSRGMAGNDQLQESVLEKAGMSDFYDAGVSGYCQGSFEGGVVHYNKCSTPHTPFWFDLQTIIDNQLEDNVTVTLPDEVQNYENVLHSASQAMWICYVAGIVVLGSGLIVGFWAFRSRMASCCTTLFAFVGFVLLFLATCLSTGIYSTYCRYFNNAVADYGIHAELDAKAFILTWVATAAALWGFVWWMFSICCAPAAAIPPYPEFEEKYIPGVIPRRKFFY